MAQTPLSVIRFKLIFIVSWLIITIDHAMLLHYFGLPWQATLTDALISNVLLLGCGLLVMVVLRYYLPRGQQYINVLALCLLLSITWLLLSRWLLSLLLDTYPGYPALLHDSLAIRFSLAFLLLGFITMVSILWYSQLEQKEQEERKKDAEKLARDAELFKLRQQLQPHFLFNSLNSINALIGSRPEEARKMVQQLSDFLRGTIKKDETQWVTLQEELQYLQLYLDIEKVRFGNRLTTQSEISEEALNYKLPSLLLQPVVENAIKFGLYDTIGETIIRIEARVQQQQLVITVRNPFDPETSSPKQGTGFGLSSVQRRLYLLFARNDLLQTSTKENIYITTVTIPQPDSSKLK